ncbi:MAG: hypothetical protein ACPG7F_00405 [Aggregatilineales bacterium]
MVSYRLQKHYRNTEGVVYAPGDICQDVDLGEHLVKIGRAVRLNTPSQPDDDAEDDEPERPVITESNPDLNKIAADGLPDFDAMNKTAIVAWSEANGIAVNKRDRIDEIVSTIMAAVG